MAMRMPAMLAAATLLAACNEIPQDARKPFAGPQETKAAVSLESRAAVQDDYASIAGVKKRERP